MTNQTKINVKRIDEIKDFVDTEVQQQVAEITFDKDTIEELVGDALEETLQNYVSKTGEERIINKTISTEDNLIVGFANIAYTGSYADLDEFPTATPVLQSHYALVSNENGKIDTSNVTATELGYLSNVTGNIQAQLNEKQSAFISGETIKTVNGESVLGEGDIEPHVDNQTISQNEDNQLQSIGIIDQNGNSALKTWTGTRAQFEAIEEKDANTLYHITDDSNDKDVDRLLVFLESIYPVGSIYITLNNSCPLENLGIGRWVRVSEGRVLQGSDENHVADTTVEAGLPNITSTTTLRWLSGTTTGALSLSQLTKNVNGVDGGSNIGNVNLNFDAANGETKLNGTYKNDVYGKSDTVQPPAYIVNIFKRIS